jgi:hypothetical protein
VEHNDFDLTWRRTGWLIAVALLVGLAFYGGLAFVALHFITKWW